MSKMKQKKTEHKLHADLYECSEEKCSQPLS